MSKKHNKKAQAPAEAVQIPSRSDSADGEYTVLSFFPEQHHELIELLTKPLSIAEIEDPSHLYQVLGEITAEIARDPDCVIDLTFKVAFSEMPNSLVEITMDFRADARPMTDEEWDEWYTPEVKKMTPLRSALINDMSSIRL